MKYISIFVISLMCILLLSGCSKQQTQNVKPSKEVESSTKATTKDIIFNEKMINICGFDQDGLIDDFKTSGYKFENISKNSDGTITLSVTEGQRLELLNTRLEILNDLQKEFLELHDGYRIELSDDYRIINFYFNPELDARTAVFYISYSEVLCAYYQLLSDSANGEWYVEINIYNSDTGKLVTSGNSENVALSYDAEDWEASK